MITVVLLAIEFQKIFFKKQNLNRTSKGLAKSCFKKKNNRE